MVKAKTGGARSATAGAPGGMTTLDTLAQPDHGPPGRGSEAGAAGRPAPETLARRARAKYATVPLATALAELRSPLERSYRNSVYCASVVEQRGGKLTSTYCGNRWCLVCNRVRTARAITRYEPHLRAWTDRQFVTLTEPNVGAEELPAAIDAMLKRARLCVRSLRHAGYAVRALRKLEVTHNARRDDYHPHLHFVVEGAEVAHALVAAWLHRTPGAVRAAQDVRPCDEGSLREVFKYFTKLTVKAGPRADGKRAVIAPVHLDVIFRAMRGHRVYQPVGFVAAVEVGRGEDDDIGQGETVAVTRIAETVMWEWAQQLADWVDLATGECLTRYEPGERFRAFVVVLSGHVDRSGNPLTGPGS